MKKLVTALVIGGAVFTAVFAAAATLGLATDQLGAGDAVVESCENDANIDINYTAEFSATATSPNASSTGGAYIVNEVTILLGPACSGQMVRVTLTGDNSTLAEVGPIAAEADGSTIFDFTTLAVVAENVRAVHAVVTGPAAP